MNEDRNRRKAAEATEKIMRASRLRQTQNAEAEAAYQVRMTAQTRYALGVVKYEVVTRKSSLVRLTARAPHARRMDTLHPSPNPNPHPHPHPNPNQAHGYVAGGAGAEGAGRARAGAP